MNSGSFVNSLKKIAKMPFFVALLYFKSFENPVN